MTGLTALEHWGNNMGGAEIWWDSCPMSFPRWRDELISTNNHTKTEQCLDRLFNSEQIDDTLLKGVTTNPNLVLSEITANPEIWETVLADYVKASPQASVENGFQFLYCEVIKQSAQALLPIWEKSGGKHGWVSAQIDPRLMFDAEAMIQQGLQFSQLAPNVMVKVPGTLQGYQTIEELTAQLISTNGTFSFTIPQILACARAVHLGLSRAERDGVVNRPWKSVITHMIGRFEFQGDLQEQARDRGIELNDTDIAWAGLAILKRAHFLLRECGYQTKLLVSSLATKSEKYTDKIASLHLTETIGGNLIFTCTPLYLKWLTKLPQQLPKDITTIESLPPKEVMGKLNLLPYFKQAYDPFGHTPEQFHTHGAFVATSEEALRSTRKMIDFVHRSMNAERLNATDKYQIADPTEKMEGALEGVIK